MGKRTFTLVREPTLELRLTYLGANERSRIEGFGAVSTTTFVVSGVVQVEHWIPDGRGWRYTRDRVRGSAAVVSPAAAVRRLESITPSVVLTFLAPTSLEWLEPLPADTLAALERARARALHEPALGDGSVTPTQQDTRPR